VTDPIQMVIAAVLLGGLTGAVRSGASVLYATLGELVTERAGIINLGTEGCMLVGACAGFGVTVSTGNPVLGVLAAGLGGGLLALIHAFLAVSRKASQLASGFAVTFFAFGLTALLGRPFVGAQIEGLGEAAIPLLGDLPIVGHILFRHDLLTYLVYVLALALWLFLRYTRWGLALRAVGENAAVAFSAGLRPSMIQYAAVMVGGVFSGIGGAQLSLAYTHTWVEGMTAGRGFIAVALVAFALWHPLRAVLGVLLFGGALAFQLQLQSVGTPVSPYFLDMMPYLLTLGVLLVWRQASACATPEGLRAIFG
jgi:general nucleoside transport system permease protein